MANYVAGDLVRVTVAFTNNSVATDPTTVTLFTKNAAAGVVSYVFGSSAIVKDSVGNYHFDITTTASGVWYWRWTGSGALTAAVEGQFTAGPSNFV